MRLHCALTGFGSPSSIKKLRADFTAPDTTCPTDKIVFQNNSTGNIISWNWDFGDGTISTQQTPLPHNFPAINGEMKYTVTLAVEDSIGCNAAISKSITKLNSCYITVPSGFTPNGDGRNDYLYPLNAYKADNLVFKVYNRLGQLMFETRDWTKKWDGTTGGLPQPTGVYIWMLKYTDAGQKEVFLKGTTALIR